MNNKIKISENKELEFDEKSYKDLNQLISNYNEDSIINELDRYNKMSEENDSLNHLGLIYPDKGRKLWLEVQVEDSYSASMLYAWLYNISKYDNKSLRIFGSTLNSIHFEIPNGFTTEEKNAIRLLHKKITGDG